MFINGTIQSGTYSDSTSDTAQGMRIGYRAGQTPGSDYYLGGYMSNLRIVKGQALYDKDFTPPSEAMYG